MQQQPLALDVQDVESCAWIRERLAKRKHGFPMTLKGLGCSCAECYEPTPPKNGAAYRAYLDSVIATMVAEKGSDGTVDTETEDIPVVMG